MESLGLVACFPDDFFDLPFEMVEEDDNEYTKPNKRPRNASSFLNPNKGDDSASLDDLQRDYPPEYEEELEWLEDKDAFPTLETFVGVLPTPNITKQDSPVSALESGNSNSNCGSSSSTNGSTIRNNTNDGNSIIMNCCGSIRVPVRVRSKRCTRRRDLQNHDSWWSVQENVKTVKPVVSKVIIGRKCQHCGAEKTPQWRAGPLGPKTLCNACGVRYKSGRLVPEYRPASSPTFSSELHSNSHRKVVEMRRQKQMMVVELGVVATKPVEKG